MITFIFALLLLLIALTAIVMQKSYSYLPAQELKRRAAHGDEQSMRLYRAVAYGGDLDLLLWIVIVLASAGGFILLTKIAPDWICFIAVASALWVFYSLVPVTRLTHVGNRITLLATPAIASLLGTVHPVLGRGAHQLQKRHTAGRHTGLYERIDLLDVIDQQLRQEDSRISTEELMIAAQALSFNDFTVHDIITPWKAVKTISSSDVIGPVVIDEAHRSGQSLIPVVEGKGTDEHIVGTLRVTQLGIRSDGQASDLMDQTVYYLHEDDSLTEALHAFYVTNQPLFVVLDSNGRPIGVITMAAMLKQLLGELPGSSAEAYTEYSEVKRRHDSIPDTQDVVPEESILAAVEPEDQAAVTENTATSDETVVE